MQFLRNPAVPYIAPFVAFVGFMALERLLPLSPDLLYTARFVVVSAVMLVFSRRLVSGPVTNLAGSVVLGLAVFVVWVAPDVLWPGYRSHWLFDNPLTGTAMSSVPHGARLNPIFIAVRVMGCVVLVPILEELFWRGWLMRRLMGHDFRAVPVGAYMAGAFWPVVLLFASEHGPYWDVGLAAGALYNWWVIRTKSLADCMVAHAVTNGALSGYVLATGQWQYWL
jgi:CAAX prenyl protease-like protein